jgi:hypothetical protein
VRLVPALDVLVRRMDNRDHRPGSGACAPSVIVDSRCDACREMRLVAGMRRAGAYGRFLNSDIAFGIETMAVAVSAASCGYFCDLLALQKQHLFYYMAVFGEAPDKQQ